MPPPNIDANKYDPIGTTFETTHHSGKSRNGVDNRAQPSCIQSIHSTVNGKKIPGSRTLCTTPDTSQSIQLVPGSPLNREIKSRFADCLSSATGHADPIMLSFHSPKGHRVCNHLINGGSSASHESTRHPTVLELCLRGQHAGEAVQIELDGTTYKITVKPDPQQKSTNSENGEVAHLAGHYLLTATNGTTPDKTLKLPFLELAPPFDGRCLRAESLLNCYQKFSTLFPDELSFPQTLKVQFSSAMGTCRGPALLILDQFISHTQSNRVTKGETAAIVRQLLASARQQTGKNLIPDANQEAELINACEQSLKDLEWEEDYSDGGINDEIIGPEFLEKYTNEGGGSAKNWVEEDWGEEDFSVDKSPSETKHHDKPETPGLAEVRTDLKRTVDPKSKVKVETVTNLTDLESGISIESTSSKAGGSSGSTASMAQLLSALESENWLAGRASIIDKQPNLSRVVAALDLLLPHQPGQEARLLGFELLAHDFPQAEVPQSVKVVRHVGSAQTGNESGDPLTLGVKTRNEVLIALLQKAISDNRIENCQMVAGVPDLTERDANRLIASLLPTPSAGLNENWSIDLSRVLEADGPAQQTELAFLSKTSVEGVLRMPTQVIELVALLDNLCLVGPGSSSLGKELYNVCSEDQFVELSSKLVREGGHYLPTLIPGLERHQYVAEPDMLQSVPSPNNAPWRLSRSGRVMYFSSKAAAIQEVLKIASAQLKLDNLEAVLDEGEIQALPLYQLISRLNRQPVPAWLQEHQQDLQANVQVNANNAQQKRAQVLQRQAEAASRREASAKQAQINIEQAAHKLGVAPAPDLVNLASSGSSTRIAEWGFDARVVLSQAQADGLYNLLDQNSERMDTAHNTRGLANATRVRANPRQGAYTRDNLCWLRSLWVSVFEQTDSADGLVQRIDQAQIASPRRNNNAQMLARALFEPYKRDTLAFLHHGEEDLAATAPAHFRTQQTFESFCQEFGQSDLLEVFKEANPSRIEGYEYKVESMLKNAVFALAPGIRETLPELKNIQTGDGLQATSDIAVAVHRALNLPVIVLEDSGVGQISVRVSAPNNHPLKGLVDRLVKGEPTKNQSEATLKQLVIDSKLPVIHLQGTRYQDGHYTLYLPRTSVLGAQLSQARLMSAQRKAG